MGLYYQLGIPKEKGNVHAVATRSIQEDKLDASFLAGNGVSLSSEISSDGFAKVQPYVADTVPYGIAIKVDITGQSMSILLNGRSVPVRTKGDIAVDDKVALDADGFFVKAPDGALMFGTVVNASVEAYDQNGTKVNANCALIDFNV